MHCTKISPEFEFRIKGHWSPGAKKNQYLLSHPHWQCIVRRAPYTARSSRRYHCVELGWQGDGSTRWRRLAGAVLWGLVSAQRENQCMLSSYYCVRKTTSDLRQGMPCQCSPKLIICSLARYRCSPWKFHANPFGTFCTKLIANRQRNNDNYIFLGRGNNRALPTTVYKQLGLHDRPLLSNR